MKIDTIISRLPHMSEEERKRVRGNAERLSNAGSAEQKSAAHRVLEELAHLARSEHQALVDRLSGMDRRNLVLEAFRAVPMTETEEKLVQVLLECPNSNSSELSQALGWGGMSWHMHFGTMCKARADYLWPAPYAEKRDADFYCGILCDHSWESGALTYTLKPDVASAFREMGVSAQG